MRRTRVFAAEKKKEHQNKKPGRTKKKSKTLVSFFFLCLRLQGAQVEIRVDRRWRRQDILGTKSAVSRTQGPSVEQWRPGPECKSWSWSDLVIL